MTWQKWLTLGPNTIKSSESEPNYISWNTDIESWNAQSTLMVEDGQLAMLLVNQAIVAILEKGTFPLDWVLDDNLLNTASSLKAYYFSRKTFSNLRWGTPAPIIVNDTAIGMKSLRAHGVFSFKLDNPKRLWQHVPNDYKSFTTDDIGVPLRAMILDEFTAKVSANQNNILQFLEKRQAFSAEIKKALAPHFLNYGLELVDFIVQSISAPDNQGSKDI
ncbi:MAG: SPFH domain-containing protein [Candidatus Berkiella sp.]